jgi:hypothetical protein
MTRSRDLADFADSAANAEGARPLILYTAKTATGTSVDFPDIPSWAKRVTVMFSGVSLSGTDSILVQIGDSGGLETTGYSGGGTRLGGTAVNGTHYTTGFGFNNVTAAQGFSGAMTLSNITGNTWAASGVIAAAATESNCLTAGAKTLTGTLDRVSVTRTGTDTFDAGTINIMVEG